MKFKNNKVAEIYNRTKGQILLATLFEVRGLLDYEIREKKIQAGNEQEYAVGRTIKLARTCGLKYLEFYMNEFSKAIHKNGKYEIDIYVIDDNVSLRILEETDIALDFAILNRRVEDLKTTNEHLPNISNYKSEEKNKIPITDFISLKRVISKSGLESCSPYMEYLELLSLYEQQLLSSTDASAFRILYKLIREDRNKSISNVTLNQEFKKLDFKCLSSKNHLSNQENTNIAKNIAKYEELAKILRKRQIKSSSDACVFLALLGEVKVKRNAGLLNRLEQTYSKLNAKQVPTKQQSVNISKYEQLLKRINTSSIGTHGTKEQNFASLLSNYKKDPTPGRLINLDILSASLSTKYPEIKLRNNPKYDNLEQKLRGKDVKKTVTENRFLSLYGTYKKDTQLVNTNKLEQVYLELTTVANQHITTSKLEIYEKYKNKLSCIDKEKLSSEEKKFLTTLKNYQKEPSQARAESLNRIYTQFEEKDNLVNTENLLSTKQVEQFEIFLAENKQCLKEGTASNRMVNFSNCFNKYKNCPSSNRAKHLENLYEVLTTKSKECKIPAETNLKNEATLANTLSKEQKKK